MCSGEDTGPDQHGLLLPKKPSAPNSNVAFGFVQSKSKGVESEGQGREID